MRGLERRKGRGLSSGLECRLRRWIECRLKRRIYSNKKLEKFKGKAQINKLTINENLEKVLESEVSYATRWG